MEYGQTRGGRLARRAGGVFYMRRALDATTPKIPGELAKALPKGDDAVREAQRSLAETMTRQAKEYVVVRSGALRSSLTAIYPGSGAAGAVDPRTRRAAPSLRNRLAPVRRR